MGTKVAPVYANLFLGKFEEENILNTNDSKNIIFYKRFLDDIFLLWKGDLTKLKRFLNHLNTLHPTIKFTYEYSRNHIDFLDTTIYKTKTSKRFKSKLYTKPTDAKFLLHHDSYQPEHTKSNIIYTQVLRCRLLTTDNTILTKELISLKSVQIGSDYLN